MSQGSLPRTIGRYEIQDELGRGMMGLVYRARDPDLDRLVALKTPSPHFLASLQQEERESFERRFLAEARAAAVLSHPGIILVHDVGRDTESGLPYIALEYLEGRTLAQIVAENGPLDWREALRLAARVAEALHHAHAHGIVHRDIKPANVMLLPSGQPKIMDFGIAKVPAAHLTTAGQFFGTPLFMSPEQALGGVLDGRSDLFSLGSLLYHLLTGQRGFDAGSIPAILNKVVHDEPPPPSLIALEIPEAVDYVVGRLLAKQPDHRYPDGRTAAEDMEDILSGRPARSHPGASIPPPPVRSEPTLAGAPDPLAELEALITDPVEARATLPETPPRAAKPALPPPNSRRPIWLTASVLALAAGLGVVLWLIRPGRDAVPPPARARAVPVAPAPATTPARQAIAAEPSPPPEPSASADPATAGEIPARLAIDLEHPLKTGVVRVWVDRKMVVEESLAGSRKKLVGLRVHTGRFADVIELAPGKHDVEVQIAWDDNRKAERLSGQFEPGSTRRLKVRLGRLRKDLSLDWQ